MLAEKEREPEEDEAQKSPTQIVKDQMVTREGGWSE
jgi:hypothetical protein